MGRPIRVMNDANCFALSEATDGAGMGAAVVFGVILGTGVGAGIVVGGHVLEGHQGISGRVGATIRSLGQEMTNGRGRTATADGRVA